ncbi:MAG: PAS domain S-box-containing protein [Gammaproteobacteria bacterium]|jgi:PAS domain S-box-containing protein
MKQATPRKALNISAELAWQLLDSAPDATIIVDHNGFIIFANSQAEEIFGYVPKDLVGESMETLIPHRYRENHPAHRHSFFTDSRFRPMGIGLELWGLRKDGSEFPVEISLSPVQTEEELLVCAAIRDITEQHDSQKALKAAKKEADRANRAKSAFLATASHDLRQPLQTLNLLNAALLRIVPDEDTLKIIENQQVSLDVMSDLLNSLLDISKLESGTIIPDITDCFVQSIFDRLRGEFESQAQAKGLRFVVKECKEVIHTDPVLLSQLIQNLIANAIRYTKEGMIQLRCVDDKTFIGIEVLDTGIGIPATDMEIIFEEFYQVNQKTGTRNEGLGLGLTIVRRLVDLLKLSLECESTPGKGSSFRLTIPRGEKKNVRRITPTKAPLLNAVGARIMLVDDAISVLDATRILLEIEGYVVTGASTIEEVITQLTNNDELPDLIISDYHLQQGETGFQVINTIRKHANKEIPAILITGDTSSMMAEVNESLKNCEVMSKPMNTDDMLALISRLTGS